MTRRTAQADGCVQLRRAPVWIRSAVTALPLLASALACLTLAAAAPPQAWAAEKGIVDYRLELSRSLDDTAITAMVDEMGPAGLGARWTRVAAIWQRLQPEAPGEMDPADDSDGDGYSDAYVRQLDAVISELHAAGLKVIMTGLDVPEWASDSRYWTSLGYDSDVVPRIDDPLVRSEFTAFARFLASRYAYAVHHFEVWNEPNLGSGLYPQRTTKRLVAAPVYLKMLKAFRAGARAGASGTCVIAGATAPRGGNDKLSTSPQVFAHYLATHKAAQWLDAYSHHPYTPRGSRNASPNLPPNSPSRCVTLYNLKVLLDEFPGKPFYLTEFAYNTEYSAICGLEVSHEDQARYLRQAYARVARWKQVKVLLWFLVTDWVPYPVADPAHAMYLGLVEADGVTRKLGWYAFAGSNQLQIAAPSQIAAGQVFTVEGTLKTRLGAMEGATVRLQSRMPSRTAWTTRGAATTSADGGFTFQVRQASTRQYRVVWDGVAESRSATVATP